MQAIEITKCFLELKKRMNLAHFHRTYHATLANPVTFLSLTERMYKYSNSSPSKGHRMDSIVKQHFVNINVSQSGKSEKKARTQIKNWLRCGRPWMELITRLGYGSLLLVPPNMTTDW